MRKSSLFFLLTLANFLSACGTSTGGVASSSVQGVTVKSDGSSSQSSLAGTATLDDQEWIFVGLMNDYRLQNGLSPLQVSVILTQSADWLSTDMAMKNYFSHTDTLGRDPFVRMAAFGYGSSGYSGENIAAGNADAQSTFTQWKNSPSHNANMLNSSYRVIGVARAPGTGACYGWCWTTDFGSLVGEVVSQ